eukprot:s200_g19.t1
MLKLVVATPDKRKVELDCSPSETFAEVKCRIEAGVSLTATSTSNNMALNRQLNKRFQEIARSGIGNRCLQVDKTSCRA